MSIISIDGYTWEDAVAKKQLDRSKIDAVLPDDVFCEVCGFRVRWGINENDFWRTECDVCKLNKDMLESLISYFKEAAQHRVHLTAFGVGMLAFLAGFGICWFVFVR